MPHPDCYIDDWLNAGMPALAELGSDAHRSVPLRVPLPPRHPVTHRDRRSHGDAKLRVQHTPIWQATAHGNRLAADSTT
jgi:hypothetical protein